MPKDVISVRVDSEKKEIFYGICKENKVNAVDVIRNYIDEVIEIKNIKISQSCNDEDLKYIIDDMKLNNIKIIDLLKSQLEEKDIQLKTKDDQLKGKDKLIENMQVLMKDNQQLLKEEQSKNLLLLESKNKHFEEQNKTSWFSFFKNRNV